MEVECSLRETMITYIVYLLPACVSYIKYIARYRSVRRCKINLASTVIWTAGSVYFGFLIDTPTKIANLLGTQNSGRHQYDGHCDVKYSFEGMFICADWRYEAKCNDSCTHQSMTVYRYSRGGSIEHCVRDLLNKGHKARGLPKQETSMEDFAKMVARSTQMANTIGRERFGRIEREDGCTADLSYSRMWTKSKYMFMVVCTDSCTYETETSLEVDKNVAVDNCLKSLLGKVYPSASSRYELNRQENTPPNGTITTYIMAK